ncbi:MAG: PhnD/SsuA/transferrin family substrate-binding protein [bacterium]
MLAKKIPGTLFLIVCAFAFLLQALSLAQEPEPIKEKYSFFLPTKQSLDGRSYRSSEAKSTDPVMILLEAFERMGEKAGVEFVFEYTDNDAQKTILEKGLIEYAKVKLKDTDFSILVPSIYIHLRDHGIKISPLATYTVDKKKTDNYCIYVRKSDGLKKLEDLKGAPVLDNWHVSENELPGYDQILFERGYDTPKGEYFNILGGKSNPADLAYALLFNKADAFVMAGTDMKFLKLRDKRFKEIVPLSCTEGYANPLIACRDGINPELIKSLKKILATMHKDPYFENVRLLFYTINGRFVPVEDSDYDAWREFRKRGLEKGWFTKESLDGRVRD